VWGIVLPCTIAEGSNRGGPKFPRAHAAELSARGQRKSKAGIGTRADRFHPRARKEGEKQANQNESKVMNHKFDELATGLTQPAKRRAAQPLGRAAIMCLAVAVLFAFATNGSDFRLGPLIQISGDSPFVGCDPGGFGPGPLADNAETEPYVVVNPTNPKNIVAAWAVSVSMTRIQGFGPTTGLCIAIHRQQRQLATRRIGGVKCALPTPRSISRPLRTFSPAISSAIISGWPPLETISSRCSARRTAPTRPASSSAAPGREVRARFPSVTENQKPTKTKGKL